MKRFDSFENREEWYPPLPSQTWELRPRHEFLWEQRFLIAGLLVLATVTVGVLLLLRQGL